METAYPLLPAACLHPSAASWQAQLRYCIRHYLALGSPAIDAQALATHLRRTEDELLAYLLHDQAPTALAQVPAQVLSLAQGTLLKPSEAQ